MKHFKVSLQRLQLHYLEEWVLKVDVIMVLLEGQSANSSFLGYDY